MHYGTPETAQKSTFFDLLSLRKRYKLFHILFLVLLGVSQTNSSIEVAFTLLSGTLPVAFRGGFLPISRKIGFLS